MKPGMFKGTFDCGRWSGGGKDGFILIVTDKESNMVVFEAEIDPTAMILAITGRGAMPIEFKPTQPYAAERVGMTRTIREVVLTGEAEDTARKLAPSYRKPNEEDLSAFREYLESAALVVMRNEEGDNFNPDGWKLDSDGHRLQQARGWSVTMQRFDHQPSTGKEGA